MNGFIFNSDVVLHLLLVVAGIMACFVAGGLMLLCADDFRRERVYDEDGGRK